MTFTPELAPYEEQEKKFYQSMLAAAPKEAHGQRIETTTGPGVPDWNLCYQQREYWIELKVGETKGPLLRPEQHVWMIRRQRAGGMPVVLFRNPKMDTVGLYIFPDSWTTCAAAGKYVMIWGDPHKKVLDTPTKRKQLFSYLFSFRL